MFMIYNLELDCISHTERRAKNAYFQLLNLKNTKLPKSSVAKMQEQKET